MMPARENPFAVERVESILKFDPSWLDLSWDGILKRFQEADYHGSIIGPHGSGKTTFLDAFETFLSEKTGLLVCRLFLNEEKNELTRQEKLFLTNAPDNAATVIFLDGAEQMDFWARTEFKRLSHGFGGVLTTRHEKRRGESVILETATSPEMLKAFISELMETFPRPESEIEALFRRVNGNIREALRTLYDQAAKGQF